jgi:hypothetical protein
VLARWRPFRPFANPLDGEAYPCEARPTDPMRNALRLRGARSLMPDKSKNVKPDPRKTPAPKPKVRKIEGDWKDVIRKGILKKFPDTRRPKIS